MDPGAMWDNSLHLADEGLVVDVNAELGDVDHLVDGVVRPVLDPLDDKIARWQNLIPSFPWIAPGWKGVVTQSEERKGSNFAA